MSPVIYIKVYNSTRKKIHKSVENIKTVNWQFKEEHPINVKRFSLFGG